MGAYKKLNKQDAFITTYTAHKQWAIYASQSDSYGIQAFNSAQKYNPTLQTLGPLATALNTSYTAQSLAQLYYPTRSAAGEIISHSFDYYYQSTLTLSGSRTYDKNRSTITDDVKPYLISIPTNLYGVNIRPGSFNVLIGSISNGAPIITGYIADGYVTNGGIGTNFDVNSTFKILDDGEGRIYVSGSNPKYIIVDIIYPHGMVVVTDDLYIEFFRAIQTPRRLFDAITQQQYYASTIAWLTTEMSFDSSHPIFTHNYHCKIRESEYNYTYNPTALSSSLKTVYDSSGNIYSTSSAVNNGIINNKLTGSAFQPYITTVGLYNDANQLIAVGKMTRPIPKSANTEMTIIVKIDI
jgi:hypothetical protein